MNNLKHRFYELTDRQVLYILIVLALGSVIISAIANPDLMDRAWWSGLLQNFGTEMAGAMTTYLMFELILGERKEENRRRELFITDLKSSIKNVHKKAYEEMKQLGIFHDGSLKEAYLDRAHLASANLEAANLEEAHLILAHLKGANLRKANLRGAHLVLADLKGTNLRRVHLEEAHLEGTCLEGAYLEGAHLEGAYLDVGTILPDGSQWIPETDMEKFTCSERPDFWQPSE